MQLTSEQIAAINHQSKSLCLIAGPGAGKTTVLVERVARLVRDGEPPQAIAIVTFSREAAEQIKHRLAERDPALAGCKVGTFHSLAFELMPWKPQVLDEEQSIDLLAKYNATSPKKASMQDVVSRKDHPAVNQYVSDLRVSGRMDYTELLHWLRDNVETVMVSHLLVDEAQDNDPIQWDIVSRCEQNGTSVFCVMDPRQQIYEWRGATYLPGLRLKDRLHLTESHRFGSQIATVANMLAKHGVPDVDLPDIVGSRPGAKIRQSFFSEMSSRGSRAVLCRTNRTVENFAAHCSQGTVKRRRPKRLTGLIQFLATGTGSPDHYGIIFPDLTGGEYLSQLKLEMLKQQYPDPVELLLCFQFQDAEHQDELEWWARLARNHSLDELAQVGALFPMEAEVTSGLVISTIHQAKGLEYDNVYIPWEPYVGDTPAQYRLSLVQVTRVRQTLLFCDGDGHLCDILKSVCKESGNG